MLQAKMNKPLRLPVHHVRPGVYRQMNKPVWLAVPHVRPGVCQQINTSPQLASITAGRMSTDERTSPTCRSSRPAGGMSTEERWTHLPDLPSIMSGGMSTALLIDFSMTIFHFVSDVSCTVCHHYLSAVSLPCYGVSPLFICCVTAMFLPFYSMIKLCEQCCKFCNSVESSVTVL